jgi:CRP-like cAMP-binding protein
MVGTKVDNRVQALSEVSLFSGCNRRELQAVARLCTPLSVETGFVLTTEGTVGRECFVIADGGAAVKIAGQPVGTVGPGDCVGEMALLDGGTRTATVTAETPLTLYVLSIPEFNSLLEVDPTIVRKLAASLARRLRAIETQYPH